MTLPPNATARVVLAAVLSICGGVACGTRPVSDAGALVDAADGTADRSPDDAEAGSGVAVGELGDVRDAPDVGDGGDEPACEELTVSISVEPLPARVDDNLRVIVSVVDADGAPAPIGTAVVIEVTGGLLLRYGAPNHAVRTIRSSEGVVTDDVLAAHAGDATICASTSDNCPNSEVCVSVTVRERS